jgi:uncharacterized protein (TIGR00290 family)
MAPFASNAEDRVSVAEPVFVSWSGGKDSAYALFELQRSPDWEIAGLLTTITTDHDRISIHGVRRELLALQAAALDLPLHEVMIPASCSNTDYETAMQQALSTLASKGISAIAFGDLFLEDIRNYRDRLVAASGMRALYPIWGRDTSELGPRIFGEGFRATLACVDLETLDESYAGRAYDSDLLAHLPIGVDPCGENGEFHTFVHQAPNFARPISIRIGERLTRGRFCYCEITHAG